PSIVRSRFIRVRDTPPLHSFPTRRSSDLTDDEVVPEHSGLLRTVDEVGELGFGPTSPISDGGIRPLRGEERFGRMPPSEIGDVGDRKSTRLNSSHVSISYAVFCLKKKKRM